MPGAADVPGAPPPGPFDKDASFEALARTTGGKSLYSRNDVDREIGESVRDGETITRSITVLLLLPATASRSEQLESRWQSRLCMQPTARGTSTRSPRRPRSPARALSTTWTRRLKAPLVYTGLSVRAEQKPGAPGTYIVDLPEEELVWSPGGGGNLRNYNSLRLCSIRRGGYFCAIHKIRPNIGDSLHRETVAPDWRDSRSGFPSLSLRSASALFFETLPMALWELPICKSQPLRIPAALIDSSPCGT
jgi:hypothetical protein